ncbi:unnamed protein product [Dovyalis caffra]|uniref:Uncharacterized protein n=1 Tax=Dovyalis caffra TaxID=77055 RepID=A0AAV1RCP5_9ROSI|nr:unnamed protein product [Dovyalis caffra]
MDPPSFPINPQAPASNPSLRTSSDGDSAYNSETNDFSHAVLKYIHDILMEDDLGDKTCMLQDCLALQAAEKSLYDVLGEEYPPSSDHCPPRLDQINESPDENFTQTTRVQSSVLQSFYPPKGIFLVPYLHKEMQSFGQFDGAMGSANKSLPYGHSGKFSPLKKASDPPELEEEEVADRIQKNGRNYSSNQTRGRRNHQHDNNGYLEEGRSKKQSSVSESVHLELLDDAFLNSIENGRHISCPLYDNSRRPATKKFLKNEQLTASDMRTRTLANKREMDLGTLLILCAQAAGNGDQKTASERLKQIRQHSSPFGDANQRLAHYFANGLEARLAGTGMFLCGPITQSSTPAADILKAYELYVTICPFRKMTNLFANRTIGRVADKATSVHIIDFGISYGFQWPCFIYRQSLRPGGPPKIRITGIELPQPGFRPAERVEETGRRLKRLADRMNVPLEYNAIAQKWETIQYEDLKIERDRDEVIVVNCMYRLKNLPDDTMVCNSPRDAVLKLIKRIHPDIFLHGVSNGSYNAPFFVTRFREALFHYSAYFDMLEANAPREDQQRLLFEREMIGRDAINVVACESTQRVERPETYKQWQMRNLRIGFRQIPFHQSIIRRVKSIEPDYHKDFIVDEDGQWVLLGWKGKIIHAISAWKPALE